MDRRDEALAAWNRTHALQPSSATTLVNRGLVHYELGQFEEALRDYRDAMSLAPHAIDARWNASWCLLKLGQFEEGWELFEARRELSVPGAARNLPKPRWSGSEDIAGRTLLVRAEQGLGDTIQFCRYLKLASDRGARVILQAPVELHGLLSGLAGMSALIAPDSTPSEFDFHCDLMSLPRAFGTGVDTIPAEVPYLRSESGKVSEWEKAMGERRRLRVGLVWSAGIRPDQPQLWTYDRRNIPLGKLADWRNPDIEFYSLQKGQPAQSQLSQAISTHWEGPHIVDCAERLKDFTETAAIIENLDLVISVDTAVAHLAGALGKPVWILLCADACWRWLLDRVDSPWYPTARLYRQVTHGNWDPVIRQVREDIARFAGRLSTSS
jgi:hypothetical protein